MIISLNWIKEYITGLKIDSIDELCSKMISQGLEVESVTNERDKYKNFIVGRIDEITQHPETEKLKICKVNIGTGVINSVCGAPNVQKEQKVCLALENAVLPLNNFVIKQSKIKGVSSEGMICAEDELGLSDDHTGIMVLNKNAKLGENFADYLGANDTIIEIGITPNRGDLYSQIGIAREIAAIYGLKITKPEIKIQESEKKCIQYADVEIINREYCRRFTGRVILNVKIKESPEWLKKRLLSVGLRPINNVVDITNFVMIETGQPLHAFDYDKIRGGKVIVKTPKNGDKFITLDSKERILNDESLMICDAERYIGIAGIMGGEFSEITNETKNVFLESAFFDPVNIRKNSKRLNLSTDASQRFERGVDIENVLYASNRASMLMQEIAEGEVLGSIIDEYPSKFEYLIAGIRSRRASDITGVELDENKIISLLEKIEIKYSGKKEDYLLFQIPEFRRHDLLREVDLIEEVARLYGYDNIDNKFHYKLDIRSDTDYDSEFNRFITKIREYFIGRGYNEIISYSQQDREKIIKYGAGIVEIENPNSVEMNCLRYNLLYGMLNVIGNNIRNSGKDISLKLFEIGKVFDNNNRKFSEEYRLCCALYGKRDSETYLIKNPHFDYFDMKGELEMFCSKLKLENLLLFNYYSEEKFGLVFDSNEKKISAGNLFVMDKESLREFDIEGDVIIAELRIRPVFENRKLSNMYSPISKFPILTRDLSIILDREVTYMDVKNVIIQSAGEYLVDIKLFDIYTDEKMGAGKKSMSLTLGFNSGERTLTDAEINKQIELIVKSLEKKTGGKLRF